MFFLCYFYFYLVHLWLHLILNMTYARVTESIYIKTDCHACSTSSILLNMANLSTPSRGSGQSTKSTNWNVKGLNHPVKRTKVLAHLKLLKTDIAFLTEGLIY